MIDTSEIGEFQGGELERAMERFEWMAEEVRDRVWSVCVDAQQQVLCDPTARVSAKESALVMLGLGASARAHAVLLWFDSAGEHRRVRLLHRIARRECRRRQQRRVPGDEQRHERAA